MASSIHIEKVKSGSFLHNDRSVKVSYLIDSSDKNECSVSADEAIKTFQELRLKAQENYTKRVNQKMQKNTVFLKEAIVNLEEHHTLKDLQPIVDKLESYGFKVLQTSIHRDEGFLNSENKKEKNYHAHITMFCLDVETGKTVKFGKNYRTELSKLQTFVADTLKMQRGKVSVKEHAKELNVKVEKASRRLDTHDYKRAMKIKEQEELKLKEKYNFREYQKKITSLEDLTKEQKKELHSLNSAVKNQKATIDELNQKIEEIQAKNAANAMLHSQEILKNMSLEEENTKLKEELNKKPKEIEIIKTVENPLNKDLEEENNMLVNSNKDTAKSLVNAQEELKRNKIEIDILENEKAILYRENEELEYHKEQNEIKLNMQKSFIGENNDLYFEKSTLGSIFKAVTNKFKELKNTIKELKNKVLHLEEENKKLINEREELIRQKTSVSMSKQQKSTYEPKMDDLEDKYEVNSDDWDEVLQDLEKYKIKSKEEEEEALRAIEAFNSRDLSSYERVK